MTIDKIKELCKNPQFVHNYGMTDREIAKALGVTHTAMNKITARIIRKLKLYSHRENIGKEDIELLHRLDSFGQGGIYES